jgi:hypothetical protein
MGIESLRFANLASDMHAIYAAFASDRGDVYVKVGSTVRPLQRVRGLVTACPFHIKRFVFCHVGSMKLARGIERATMHKLAEYRTRGEWYRFKAAEADAFKEGIRWAYRRVTGRRDLKWTEIGREHWSANPLYDKAS